MVILVDESGRLTIRAVPAPAPADTKTPGSDAGPGSPAGASPEPAVDGRGDEGEIPIVSGIDKLLEEATVNDHYFAEYEPRLFQHDLRKDASPGERLITEHYLLEAPEKKYPHIRVERTYRLAAGVDITEAGERNLVGEAALVADHLLVRLEDHVDAAAFEAGLPDEFEIRKRLGPENLFLVAFPLRDRDSDIKAASILRAGGPGISYVEPDFLRFAGAIPNDSRFGELWGMNSAQDADIDAPEAWDLFMGNGSIVVGIIDTGIDYNHPDLAANIWVNPGEDLNGNGAVEGFELNGIDDDGNGYVDDLRGYDFAYEDSNPMDGNAHGTHVAGTVGGAGNNGLGVAGVAWDVGLAALMVLDDSGSGYTSDIRTAVAYAASKGMRVTNNSYGGGGFSSSMSAAIQSAGQAGMLFVAAAGNDGRNADTFPNYPSGYTHSYIVSVASMTSSGQLSSFSNYGSASVDLGAPGSGILSTVPGGAYANFSGTSMATPHVVGAAALALMFITSLSVDELRIAIFSSVDPAAALAGRCVAGGRLSVNSLLLEADSGVPPLPAAAPPSAYDLWAAFYFGSAVDSNAGSAADPDGDGRTNGEEYLEGTDPTSAHNLITGTPRSWDAAAAGTSDGLVLDSNDRLALRGAVQSVRVTKTGALSGKMTLDGARYSFKGAIAPDGSFAALLTTKSAPARRLELQLLGTDSGFAIGGRIKEASGNDLGEIRLLRAGFDRSDLPPQAGSYTVVFPADSSNWPAGSPGGDGYGTLKVIKGGWVTALGVLGDGAKFSTTAYLSAYGELALYKEVYRTSPARGFAGGFVSFRDVAGTSDLDGTLHWVSHANAKARIYPAGFNLKVPLVGSRYDAPAKGELVLGGLVPGADNAVMAIGGAGMADMQMTTSWNASNRIEDNLQKVRATVSTTTGLMAGSYADKAAGVNVKIGGVAFQKQNIVLGGFVTGGESGYISVAPR